MKFLNKSKNALEEFAQKAVEQYLRTKHSDFWMSYAYEKVTDWEPLTDISDRATRWLYETIIANEDPDLTDEEVLMVEVWCIYDGEKTKHKAFIYRYEEPDETETYEG